MRILQVRFKNLGSLRGEWTIDFTHPAYTSEGFFAITGPTGAGKTTVLDAISLALYARTPRLKDVTQGGNEIMSRRTGECFAEVVFETGGEKGRGKYCVHWAQHRSRRQADGALQSPRHEIADAVTGKILETKQKNVGSKIEEVTGLNYDRFVRSTLLAQGSFATFLQSSPSERSPVLEQITGTEIYSQISVRTHEIRNAERAMASVLEAELSGMSIPTEEERREMEKRLNGQLQEESLLERDIKQREEEIEWLDGMERLQKELDALEDHHRDLSSRQKGFEPELLRLERAGRALELGSAHAALKAFRKEQDSEKHALAELHSRLPELEADTRRAEEALQLAQAVLSERLTEQRNMLDLLRRVRELELRQSEKLPLIEEAHNAAEQIKNESEELRIKYEADLMHFDKVQLQMRDARKFLQLNAIDERLVEQLEGIRARFESLDAAVEKRKRLTAECAAAEEARRQAHRSWNEQSVLHETVKARYATEETRLRQLRDDLSETLKTRPLSEWREKRDHLMERRRRERRVEELLTHRLESTNALIRLTSQAETLHFTQKTGQEKITDQQAKIQALEKDARQLETQMELIRRIRDLEEERLHLKDGVPCPLCGSTDHPYAEGELPQEEETDSALHEVRKNLRRAGESLSAMQVEKARREQELLQNQEEKIRLQTGLEEMNFDLAENLAFLQINLSLDEDALSKIGHIQQKTEEQIQQTRLLIERAEKIEADMQTVRESCEMLGKEREQATRMQQEAGFRQEAAKQEWERLSQELRRHEEELKNIRLDLIGQTSPYGFKNLPDENPAQVLDHLQERLRKWQEQYSLRVDLEKQISARDRDLHYARDTLTRMNLELKDKVDTEKRLRGEWDTLQQQRTGLFGKKDPDEEEAAQAAAVQGAQLQTEAKREARDSMQQKFNSMRERVDDLSKTINIRAVHLQKTNISFDRQLLANDFKNEDAYLSSCLPEEERRALQERAGTLQKERTELDARRTDKKFSLEELRRLQKTTRPPEEVREILSRLYGRQKELQRSIGALRQRLEDARNFDAKRQKRASDLERQKRELQRWEELHALIGSADGQKFRNFAQGLTFEIVVRHANRELQKMTDRYLLIRDEAQPLELNIVDSYQAGEIRSVKNLSGGESFIVSLALALGLSRMSSHRVRVDSLFLDEGFGTLDEDALDTALSTLAGLRREGRLIGVISHIEALRERIGTQIEIIPQGNGNSLIQAPGVTFTQGGL